MWRRWSRALEALGRIRIPFALSKKLRVGDPTGVDARGGSDWRAFLASERLYDVWGPLPESPWLPFHCVPLFAALDRLAHAEIGPTPQREENGAGTGDPLSRPVLPASARPGAPAPEWLTDGTWTILDLPGPTTVEAAAWLVTAAGCQPVCTFDNWPHAKGVLRPEETLAELLRWATTVADARRTLTPTSPPLWICDSQRLGGQPGRPGEFDNRYFLDDSILPGHALLRRAGIHRAVYVTLGSAAVPTLDLESYFSDLLKAGIVVLHLELESADELPRRLSAPISPRPAPSLGFRRSGAGGFGTEVPEPSSGSSG